MGTSMHKLLSAEREQLILRHLRQTDIASVSALCESLGVSEATVRRDLQSLQERGLISRVHGGASISNDENHPELLFSDKEGVNLAEKQRIAECALTYINEHDVIYLDGGSTSLCLARLLEGVKNLTIVTNSLMAASILMETGHRLVLTGGEFRALSRTLVGPLTSQILDNLVIDKAFMGTFGFTVESGMTTTDVNEAFTKSKVISRAKHVILLADHSKFGKPSFACFGAVSDIEVLITDSLSEKFRHQLQDIGVKIQLC